MKTLIITVIAMSFGGAAAPAPLDFRQAVSAPSAHVYGCR